MAEDSVSIHYLYYDEDSGRTTVKTPSLQISKDFGLDYSVDFSYSYDTLSGASPTFYDAASGASAKAPEGVVYSDAVRYDNVPYSDNRRAYGLQLTRRMPQSRDELNIGLNYSKERDYIAKEVTISFMHYLDSYKNSSLTYGFAYQHNTPKVACSFNPKECDSVSGASGVVNKRMESYQISFGYSQIIDSKSEYKLSLFGIFENGYLSNPYMKVVRDNNGFSAQIVPENKPPTRNAIGVDVEYKKAWQNDMFTKLYYRFYHDDWDIDSHTVNIEMTKDMQKFSYGGGVRWYRQSRAFFYSGTKDYFTNQIYASSDRRMDSFASSGFYLCLRYRQNDKIEWSVDGGWYNQPKFYHSSYFGIGVKYRY